VRADFEYFDLSGICVEGPVGRFDLDELKEIAEAQTGIPELDLCTVCVFVDLRRTI
jgi:hypothetical protein